MIDFQTVTREFRSLVHRRRNLMTFLGSVFATTGILLQNVLGGKLPASLEDVQDHIFAFYALVLMVPTLILALRMARLHGGMVLNGILYARLLQDQAFTKRGDPRKAARHNLLGVSFLQFLLMSLIGGFSATILVVAILANLFPALLTGLVVVVALLLWYFRFHAKAVTFAFQKIASEPCGPVEREAWQEHVSASLEDANNGMLAEIGFVGLIMFSMFEKISSLGGISKKSAGPAYEDIQHYGPWIATSLMLTTCVFGMVVYLRVRVAVGSFSLQLDPSDRPFRPLRLTDSLLGFLLLVFLFTVSLHMLLLLLLPGWDQNKAIILGMDATAFILAVLAEQLTLAYAARHYQKS
jgi:hypothetical protein